MKKVNKTIQRVRDVDAACGDDLHKEITAMKRLEREGRRTGDALLVGAACHTLASVYMELGDNDGMLTSALKAKAMLRGSKEYELVAKVHTALCYAFSDQENDHLAMEEIEEAYRIIKRHRIKGHVRVIVLNSLATSYHQMGDCKTSIKLLEECRAISASEAPDDTVHLAMVTINLAEFYYDNREPEKARETLESMADWIGTVPFPPIVCDYYLRSAILHYRQGDRESGDADIDKAFTLVPEGRFPNALLEDIQQSCAFLTANGDRDRATGMFGLIRPLVDESTDGLEQFIAVRAAANYYNGFGDRDTATEYGKRLDELYTKRTNDLKSMQLNAYKKKKTAEREVRSLQREMKKNAELFSLEPLTGLLNRSALLTVATSFIESAAKKKKKVGAIFIDIDHFKECNDTYGHARGDEIIKEVANACREEENANVRFARYGGDELFGITRGLSTEEVAAVARNICRRIRNKNIPNANSPVSDRITLSVGIVNVPVTERTDTIIEIANYADKAAYHAKSSGKNAIWLLEHTADSSEYKKIGF